MRSFQPILKLIDSTRSEATRSMESRSMLATPTTRYDHFSLHISYDICFEITFPRSQLNTLSFYLKQKICIARYFSTTTFYLAFTTYSSFIQFVKISRSWKFNWKCLNWIHFYFGLWFWTGSVTNTSRNFSRNWDLSTLQCLINVPVRLLFQNKISPWYAVFSAVR